MAKKNESIYLYEIDPLTGKRRKQKFDAEDWGSFWDDSDERPSKGYKKDVVRVLPCPYKFDSPEVAKELSKPLRTSRIMYEVTIENSITVDVPNDHIHEVIMDADKSKFPPDTDFTEYEFDIGELDCGISYQIVPKINVTLASQETVEDTAANNYRKELENNARTLVSKDDFDKNKIVFEGHQKLFDQMNEYLQKHLVQELQRTITKLEAEAHLLDDRSADREASIRLFLAEEEAELRKRLSTAKGRVPTKKRSDFQTEKNKFIKECLQAFEKIEGRQKGRLNRNQLSKELFKGSDNTLQSLRRKLKDFDLSFEEIVDKYSEQKSS